MQWEATPSEGSHDPLVSLADLEDITHVALRSRILLYYKFT